MRSGLFSSASASSELSWDQLTEEQKQQVESVYTAYQDVAQYKVWRADGDGKAAPLVIKEKEIRVDQTVSSIYENKKLATANAWTNFALRIKDEEKKCRYGVR